MFGPDGMSIGLGIFLASLYLGTIYLYVQTRDRWNWSRLIARGAFLVVGGGVGGALIYGAAVGYEKWQARPRVIAAIGPIAVGESWSDVVFKVGKFEQAKDLGATLYEDDARYSHESLPLTVTVRQGHVRYVVYHCTRNAELYGAFNGVRCGDDGNKVTQLFGAGVRVLCQKESDSSFNFRVYDVVEYGTRFVMSENKVRAIAVAAPRELQAAFGINWVPCGVPPLDMRSVEEAKKTDESPQVNVKTSPGEAKTTSGK